MIGGSGEQLTLRAVARHANACNLFGPPEMVKHKLEVLQRDCEAEGRSFDEIERTNTATLLLTNGADSLTLVVK
jgi:alkanesulfonate monooxygenase SsuD/methylene tetrahydromethanopterin reductase-like flavin-dependent oxidoreductase (luciferase family)